MIDLLIISFLIVLNGFLAMSEIAIVTAKKSRLEEKARKGSKNAGLALKLGYDPERFLSAIQVGITFIGIISGAYGGVQLTEDILPYVSAISFLAPYANELSYIIVVTAITYFSLVVGELVPKSLAINNAEPIAIFSAPILNVLTKASSPLVSLLSVSTKVIIRAFGIKDNPSPPVTEDELKILIDQGSVFGSIEKEEGELIKRVFKFGDRKANSIMTHRTDVVWIDVNDSFTEIEKTIMENDFSIFPIGDGSLDDILGIITAKDFIRKCSGLTDIQSLIKQPYFVVDTFPAYRVLNLMKEQQIVNALVVDEYGVFQGIITLRDILENIIGDLPEKGMIEEPEYMQREDGSFLVDGDILLDDLPEALPLHKKQGSAGYVTLAGLIIHETGSIPKTGDRFSFGGFQYEIVDMDGSRIDKVLISKE